MLKGTVQYFVFGFLNMASFEFEPHMGDTTALEFRIEKQI